MFRIIKQLILIVVLGLVVCAVVKDKVFDTPQNCRKKIPAFIEKSGSQNNLFEADRILIYKMYFWSIIPMGQLTFSTRNESSDIIFSFSASTNGAFVERFVNARASVESYCSKIDLLPYKYIEQTEVKGKIKKKEVFYDRKNLLSIYGDKKIKISKDASDPVAAFMHVLTLSLKSGQTDDVPFLTGHDLYVFHAELKNSQSGIDDMFVTMRRKNLTSNHGGSLHVWVTTNTKIPLVFKSWTPAGYASVVLDKVLINREEK